MILVEQVYLQILYLEIVHTNRLYLRDEYTGESKNASGSGTYTLTVSGQLFQFRKSNSSFNNDLLFGPPHIVLPLKYSTVNNNTTPNGDITDWIDDNWGYNWRFIHNGHLKL